jgi:hypothetical protein
MVAPIEKHPLRVRQESLLSIGFVSGPLTIRSVASVGRVRISYAPYYLRPTFDVEEDAIEISPIGERNLDRRSDHGRRECSFSSCTSVGCAAERLRAMVRLRKI